MPVRMDNVTVTQDDVTQSMRSDTLKRIDQFIKTANEREASTIIILAYYSVRRLMLRARK